MTLSNEERDFVKLENSKVKLLDETLPVSLYYQLKQIVIDKIKTGEWAVDSKIPTELELSEYYGISRATVRQALKELVAEGSLYRKQGKGTFVLPHKIEQRLNSFYSFSNEIRKLGYSPSTTILSFDLIEADSAIEAKLRLDGDLKVFRIHRLRLADEEPFAAETSYVPRRLYPGLTREAVGAQGLYTTMRSLAGYDLESATETFEAALLDAPQAKLLNVKRPAAGLYLERLTYHSAAEVAEYCSTFIRGDRYRYSILLR
jgi:GntR family transcriptional regulator